MPSSKKTPFLRLNKWLGSDKPKKDDFNEDNEIVDRSIGALDQRLEEAAAAQAALEEQLAADITASAGALGGRIDSLGQRVDSLKNDVDATGTRITGHTGDSSAHITGAERSKWNNMAPVVNSYTGSGVTSRKITLGFKPSAGFVYALDRPLMDIVWDNETNDMFSAMLSSAGCSKGLKAESDGFTAYSMGPDSQGYSYKLNAQNVTYAYVMWR